MLLPGQIIRAGKRKYRKAEIARVPAPGLIPGFSRTRPRAAQDRVDAFVTRGVSRKQQLEDGATAMRKTGAIVTLASAGAET
jgi:hypothetical protein